MTAVGAFARGWIAAAQGPDEERWGPAVLPALVTRLERRLPPRGPAGLLGTPRRGSPSSAGRGPQPT